MSEAAKIVLGFCLAIAGICGTVALTGHTDQLRRAQCAMSHGTWGVVDSVMVMRDQETGAVIAWNRIPGCIPAATPDTGRR